MLRALWLLAAVAAILGSCHSGQPPAQRASNSRLKPFNVVVVTIDTLRPDHLHCYGYSNIETPAIDALAARGALFENAVAQTPLTPPSHASIFTGQYPPVHGVRNTGGFILQSSARPLARILHEQGWDTAAFVSSAVLKKTFGFNNGFDVYDDQMPKPVKGADTREDPERRGGDTVDRALHWLDQQSGKPFFLWVHLYDPHLPYDPPGAFKQKYRNAPYDGEIAYTDQQLGRLLDAIVAQSREVVPVDHLLGVQADVARVFAHEAPRKHRRWQRLMVVALDRVEEAFADLRRVRNLLERDPANLAFSTQLFPERSELRAASLPLRLLVRHPGAIVVNRF